MLWFVGGIFYACEVCCCAWFLFFFKWKWLKKTLKMWEVILITVLEEKIEHFNYAWFLMCYLYLFLFIRIISLGFLSVSSVKISVFRRKDIRTNLNFYHIYAYSCLHNETTHDESCITSITYSKYREKITDRFSNKLSSLGF